MSPRDAIARLFPADVIRNLRTLRPRRRCCERMGAWQHEAPTILATAEGSGFFAGPGGPAAEREAKRRLAALVSSDPSQTSASVDALPDASLSDDPAQTPPAAAKFRGAS